MREKFLLFVCSIAAVNCVWTLVTPVSYSFLTSTDMEVIYADCRLNDYSLRPASRERHISSNIIQGKNLQ